MWGLYREELSTEDPRKGFPKLDDSLSIGTAVEYLPEEKVDEQSWELLKPFPIELAIPCPWLPLDTKRSQQP